MRISNLPTASTALEVEEICKHLGVVRVSMEVGGEAALVVLETPAQAQFALSALKHSNSGAGGALLKVEAAEVTDLGVQVTVRGLQQQDASSSMQQLATSEITAALEALSIKPKSMALHTNARADICFLTVDEVGIPLIS